MVDCRKMLNEMLSLYIEKHPEQQKEAGEMVSLLWRSYYGHIKGGAQSSAAKTKAVRENGKKGGRPPIRSRAVKDAHVHFSTVGPKVDEDWLQDAWLLFVDESPRSKEWIAKNKPIYKDTFRKFLANLAAR